MPTVDLNADLGESFGHHRLGDDDALLAIVSSANIACGFHAGDPITMRDTAAAAARRGVAIGAHPGYPDLLGFGRRDLDATPDEVAAYVVYQLGALQACATAASTRVRYVKPHGALYNRAAREAVVAAAIAAALARVDSSLVLLGLAGSAILRAGDDAGLRTASEAFVDRAYRADGSLLPRTTPGAVLHDRRAVADRAARIVHDGTVESVDGARIALRADSLCVHGDSPGAVGLVGAVRERLERDGIAIAAFA